MKPKSRKILNFASEKPTQNSQCNDTAFWKILVVDDDKEVHHLTRLCLENFHLEGHHIKLYSTFTAEESKTFLLENPDTAVILLDVVMETDVAGLDLVHWIRKDWKNDIIRIILRTGQPGVAPEKEVISSYKINDYKSKTELTELKLYTTIAVACRSFQDLNLLKRSEEGFKKIITASGELFRNRSWETFYSGVLMQLTSLLRLDEHSVFIRTDGVALKKTESNLRILAATGEFEKQNPKFFNISQNNELADLIHKAIEKRSSFFTENYFIGFFPGENLSDNIIVLRSSRGFMPLDKDLIHIFSSNIAMSFENLDLTDQIENTQREMIFTLTEVVECRSKNTGNHIRRVGELAHLLSKRLKLSTSETEILFLAAPMHDIGKIGIADDILNKPTELTTEEKKIMKTHTTLGYEILKSGVGFLRSAAVIARNHHEQWNGQGYPDKLKGEDIPLEARITAVCDVFDALSHHRPYKEAWNFEKIQEYIISQKGILFDPVVVEALFQDFDEVVEIMNEYKD